MQGFFSREVSLVIIVIIKPGLPIKPPHQTIYLIMSFPAHGVATAGQCSCLPSVHGSHRTSITTPIHVVVFEVRGADTVH